MIYLGPEVLVYFDPEVLEDQTQANYEGEMQVMSRKREVEWNVNEITTHEISNYFWSDETSIFDGRW
jgi:hypothetical protein